MSASCPLSQRSLGRSISQRWSATRCFREPPLTALIRFSKQKSAPQCGFVEPAVRAFHCILIFHSYREHPSCPARRSRFYASHVSPPLSRAIIRASIALNRSSAMVSQPVSRSACDQTRATDAADQGSTARVTQARAGAGSLSWAAIGFSRRLRRSPVTRFRLMPLAPSAGTGRSTPSRGRAQSGFRAQDNGSASPRSAIGSSLLTSR